jgi:bifunctional non-homologous end joining protein LigD
VLNRRFPSVVQALGSLGSDFVLDGELVALDSQGRPSFQILENNLSRTLPVYFYCFDLLNRDGETLMSSPIERRRDLLHNLRAAPEDPVCLSPLLHGSSGQVLEAVPIQESAREKGLALGRIVNRRENGRVPLDQTAVSLPGRFR